MSNVLSPFTVTEREGWVWGSFGWGFQEVSVNIRKLPKRADHSRFACWLTHLLLKEIKTALLSDNSFFVLPFLKFFFFFLRLHTGLRRLWQLFSESCYNGWCLFHSVLLPQTKIRKIFGLARNTVSPCSSWTLMFPTPPPKLQYPQCSAPKQ